MATRMEAPFSHLNGRKHYYTISHTVFEIDTKYVPIKSIGRGAYGVVCSSVNKETNEKVTIKKINNVFGNRVDALRTLRELKLLRHIRHENVIALKDVMIPVYQSSFLDVYLVCELMDTDLHHIIKSPQPLSTDHCKYFLYQGLDIETTCQVQDWPCFLCQALSVLLAVEIVELLPWEKLASIRKNRKSIESQNQRIVIDFHCFYLAFIAHIALGFLTQQRDLIGKGKVISESLIASEGTDLKFQEAFCLFLLRQGDESVAAEKLHRLNLNSSTTSRKLISGKESREVLSATQSLESWMKGNVLVLFPDTRDCSPSLDNYFTGEKKAGKKQYKRAQPIPSSINLRPLSHSTFDRKTCEQPDSSTNFSQHL